MYRRTQKRLILRPLPCYLLVYFLVDDWPFVLKLGYPVRRREAAIVASTRKRACIISHRSRITRTFHFGHAYEGDSARQAFVETESNDFSLSDLSSQWAKTMVSI